MFWNASLEELKNGYIQDNEGFTCLLCGEKAEQGVVYRYEDTFYEAERYMRIHIEIAHDSVFEYLLQMDKKLTGLTEQQKKLLFLFYQGKSDKDIQAELGLGSASTIRHHRFVLKEKERQAKIFLALMELLKEKDTHAPTFVSVHKTATMVDDRYNITEAEQEKIVNKYFSSGALIQFPSTEKQRLIVLREICARLKQDYMYSEQELNETLTEIYPDYALIRRYLVDYGFIDRKQDGSQYWLKK